MEVWDFMKPTKDVPTGCGSSVGTFLLSGDEDTQGAAWIAVAC